MGVVIPHQELSSEALLGVIEDFINREGTDYGESPVELATKVAQVRTQLEKGKIVLLYDQESATVNLVTAEAYRKIE